MGIVAGHISVSGYLLMTRAGEIIISTIELVLTSNGNDIPQLRTAATWFEIFKRGLWLATFAFLGIH
jgi:hypothetical protein